MTLRFALPALLALAAATAAPAQIVFVDAAAPGPSDGSTWATAYRDLGTALETATSGEVWVAAGTYTPSPSDRTASFEVRSGVEVYGGFPSGGGSLAERDPDAHPTVLSGDLAGDDQPGFVNVADNSYHVIYLEASNGVGYAPDTVLDGLTVTGGNADGSAYLGEGGGLACKSRQNEGRCEPTLRHVRFVANRAETGGGAFFEDYYADARPVLEDVTFEGNQAVGDGGFDSGAGGGLAIESASVTLVRPVFLNNTAYKGAGLYVNRRSTSAPPPRVEGGRFEGNEAENLGGGALIGDGDRAVADLVDVEFVDNTAVRGGGVAVATGSGAGGVEAGLLRTTFVGNRATRGGAVYVYGDEPGARADLTLVSSSAVGNRAGRGAAVYVEAEDGADLFVRMHNAFLGSNVSGRSVVETVADADEYGSIAEVQVAHAVVAGHVRNGALFESDRVDRITVRNSIVWGNTGPLGTALVDHAIVDGGCSETSVCQTVLDADPLFADPVGPDGVVGTLDDDVRTVGLSPAVDAGLEALLPPDDLDLDADGDVDEPLPLDPAGTPRAVGPDPDLGIFERSDEAFVELDPEADRRVIGSLGGSLAFTLRVRNTSPAPIGGDLWAVLVFEDGSELVALGPEDRPLAPGEAYGPVVREVEVPAGSPVGGAEVRVFYGDYPAGPITSAAFDFAVSSVPQLTVQVTTTTDEFDGVFGGDETGEGCSLREAVEAVDTMEDTGGCALVGGGRPALISVPQGLYFLELGGGLDVESSVRIVGAGMALTTITAATLEAPYVDRVFTITGDGTTTVELADLSLNRGVGGAGGGVYAVGVDLTLTRVDVSDNRGADGGGVYFDGGTLVLDGATVRNNTSFGGEPVFDDEAARDGGRGGGVAAIATGAVIVRDSEIVGNTAGAGGDVLDDDGTAGDGGRGGGMYVAAEGPVTIEGSLFGGNEAGRGGSADDGQTGDGGPGGGFYVRGGESLTVVDTRIVGNASGVGGYASSSDTDSFGGRGGSGGGAYVRDVDATFTEVTVQGNRTGDGGGGNDEGAGDGGRGAGLAVVGGDLRIERSTIAGNTAGDGGNVSAAEFGDPGGDGGTGGGLYLASTTTAALVASTVSGNAAGAPGSGYEDGDPGLVGGIVAYGPLTLENVTVTDNAALAGAETGGLRAYSNPVTVANSVVAGNTVGDLPTPTADCFGSVTDAGFNVVAAGTGCPSGASTTVPVAPGEVFTRVLEADLADNGGPTLTHALLDRADNPAVDIGGTCGPVDQRGMPAPVDGPDADEVAECDAGSVEAGDLTATLAFRVEEPRADDFLVLGQRYALRWTTLDPDIAEDDRVRISTLCESEAPVVLFARAVNDGQVGFRLPAEIDAQGGPADPDGGCTVEVALAADPSRAAESGRFVVQDPTLAVAVVEPDGSGTYSTTDPVLWRWDAGDLPGGDSARLSLVCEGRPEVVLAESTPNDGEETVALPPGVPENDNCHAQVGSVEAPSVYGRSPSFRLSAEPAPALTITSPSRGDVLTAGTQTVIEWSTQSVPPSAPIRILLDDASGGEVVRIAQTDNDGAFTWSIPSDQPASAEYRIRVSGRAADGTRVADAVRRVEIRPSDGARASRPAALEPGWTRLAPGGAAPVDVAVWLSTDADRVVARTPDGRQLVVDASGATGDLRALLPGEAVEVWTGAPLALDVADPPTAGEADAPAPHYASAPDRTVPTALWTVRAPGLADGDEVAALDADGRVVGRGTVRDGSAVVVLMAPLPEADVEAADGEGSDAPAVLGLEAWRATTGAEVALEPVAVGGLDVPETATVAAALVVRDGADWAVEVAAVPALAPDALALEAPYPNPTSDAATVRFGTPGEGPVRVELFDVRGRRVAVLSDETRAAGWHEVPVPTGRLAAGVYLVRVSGPDGVEARTMTVAR